MERIVLFFHILFAVLWIGGMIYSLFFLKPSLKEVPQEKRHEFLKAVNGKFLPSAGASALLLLITGIFLLLNMRPDLLKNGLFHFKLLLYAIMLINLAYIYFYLYRKGNFSKIMFFVGVNLTLGILILFIITQIR